MKLITSAGNQIYKKAAQLKQKKYRDEQNRYLIEGPNLIREAYQNGGDIEMIVQSDDFHSDDIFNGFRGDGALNREFIPVKSNAPMAVMSSGLFRKLSDTESPQGILAIVKKRIYTEEEFFSPETAASNLIVLDRLQDPGNIGTILRTADAAGFRGAILLKGTTDIYSPKIVRAAAGSLFRLPVLTADTPDQVIGLLKKYGKRIICTAPDSGKNYYDIDMSEDAAVIIGNEGNGACDEFLVKSEFLVKIPMEGTIESLNAAVSAGILMYESVRQRYRKKII